MKNFNYSRININKSMKRRSKILSSLIVFSFFFSCLGISDLSYINSKLVSPNSRQVFASEEETSQTEPEIEINANNSPNFESDAENVDEILDATQDDFAGTLANSKVEYKELLPYLDYVEKYKDFPLSSEDKVLFKSDEDKLIDENNKSVSFDCTVNEDSLFAIKLVYSIKNEGMGSAQIAVKVDGEVPYSEASLISLRRLYRDQSHKYLLEEKNQSFPSQEIVIDKQSTYLYDDKGYISRPLLFALSKGEHKIDIEIIQDKLEIYELVLAKNTEVETYRNTVSDDEYSRVDLRKYDLAEYELARKNWLESISKEESKVASPELTSREISEINTNSFQYYDKKDNLIVLEAETASLKNDPSLLPQNDRTSSLTSPYHPTYTRMNTIGGKSWKTPSTFIEWTVNVPEDGLYKLGFRFLQNTFRGLPVTRELKINGKTPFAEAEKIPFYFAQNFQTEFLHDDAGEEYYFHLDKGDNKIRLTYVLADVANYAGKISRAAQKLNSIYRRIMVITGTSPDPYRDYELLLRIPDLLERIEEAKLLLDEVIESLRSQAGDSDVTSVLSRTSHQLDKFLKKPQHIAKSIGQLKDNVTALGQWNLDVTIQNLTLDKLYIAGENSTLPRADMSFIESCKHEFLAFVGSFYNEENSSKIMSNSSDLNLKENNASSDRDKLSKKVEVWVTTGRDQLDVIRRMVGDSFIKEKGIDVELKLVSSDIVLPSTFTGNGPDVVIQAGTTLPINFAFRGAALDLSTFADYEEYSKNFSEATIKTFEYRGSVYALPDQMSFPVMFYRKDVLSKLNIPVPQTWDDILSILPFLQANNMEFYLDTATPLSLGSAVSIGNSKAVNSIYLSMLYQAGGRLYSEDGLKSEITSAIGQEIFKKWTDYYTKHSFPTVVNFLTRFRLGEVPIAIVDFTNYNSLTVGAPEIAGEYGMAMVPGTKQEDGSIRRDIPVTTSAAMIVKTQVDRRGNKDSAWEFLKWWTAAKTQSNYASEMEALLGAAARYPVANLNSFQEIPWAYDIKKVLNECLASLREVPQIPGSYITGRDIENAFYEVINNPRDAVASESLEKYAEQIDAEIMNKLKEFKLLPEEGGSIK